MGEYNRAESVATHPVREGRQVSQQRRTTQVRTPQPLPVVTSALLVVIVVVFLAMWRAGHGNVMDVALQFGDKEQSLIRQGEWWRLITPIFLHGNPMHLIVNGLSLVWFGSQIERIYGARRYFLIFMLAGVAGNLLSYLRLPTPSLGASGSLFGLVGAGIVLPLRYRRLIADEARNSILRQLVAVAAINFAISFSPGIDIWAHLGGFLGGGIAALFLMPPVLDDRPANAARDAVLTGLTLVTLAVTLLAGWSQWRVAGREALPNTVAYMPSDYWSFRLPSRWQPVQVPGDPSLWWVTPDKAAQLNVRDIPYPPDLPRTEQAWSRIGVVQPQIIGGQNALTMARQDSVGTEYRCVISVFGHEIDIVLDSSLLEYQDAHHDFELMLSSVQFLHAPPPTAPDAPHENGLAVQQGDVP